MPSLDTTVQGDPASVRSTASGVGALSGAIGDAATGFGSAAGQSDLSWTGNAADAFRGRITTVQQATRAAAEESQRLHTALHTLADQLDTVKAKIAHADATATDAGLTVSGTSIQAPTPPPTTVPAACYTPAAASAIVAQQKAAMLKYQVQKAAYQSCEQEITTARQLEQTAHAEFETTATEVRTALSALTNQWVLTGTGTAADAISTTAAQAEKFEKAGDKALNRANTLTQQAATLPEDDPGQAALLRSADRAFGDADDANDTADGLKSGLSKLLGDDATSDLGKLGDVAGKVSTVTGVVPIVLDVAHHDPASAAGDTASLATGIGAGTVIESLSLSTALETGGASLVAGGLAYGTGEAVKHFGPPVWNWAKNQVGGFVSGLASGLSGSSLIP
jgi:uncharacterized protein YukE